MISPVVTRSSQKRRLFNSHHHRYPRRADLLVSAGRSALSTRPVDTIFTTAQKEQPRGAGEVTIIDLDLSRYNAIASRFAEERQQTLDFLKSGIATRNPTSTA